MMPWSRFAVVVALLTTSMLALHAQEPQQPAETAEEPRRKRVAKVVGPTEAIPPAESPLVGGPSPDLPQPNLDEEKKTDDGEKPEKGEGKQPIVCGACGQPFKYQSWYIRHVKAHHKDRLQELLPDLPGK